MKKLIALLLVLASVASLLVLPASAEGLDKETVQKAVVETAYAYYRKGMGVQYDSTEMTYQNRIKSGPARLTSGDSPEMAAKDYTIYTVCSDWCYDVYYNAFGYKLAGSARNCLTFNMTPTPTSDPTVVLKFGLYMEDVHTAAGRNSSTSASRCGSPVTSSWSTPEKRTAPRTAATPCFTSATPMATARPKSCTPAAAR